MAGSLRPTLLHRALLRRLSKVGILAKFARVPCVSAARSPTASSTGGWRSSSRVTLAVDLRKPLVEPLRAFCYRTVDTPIAMALTESSAGIRRPPVNSPGL